MAARSCIQPLPFRLRGKYTVFVFPLPVRLKLSYSPSRESERRYSKFEKREPTETGTEKKRHLHGGPAHLTLTGHSTKMSYANR